MIILQATIALSLVYPSISNLQCWEGSKGKVNGQEQSNFVVNSCDDGMKYCFESYSDDLTEVTAACQTASTDDKLLNVCNTGCVNHTEIGVTVCCCADDLCNLSPDVLPSDMPTIPTTSSTTTTTTTTSTTTTSTGDNPKFKVVIRKLEENEKLTLKPEEGSGQEPAILSW